MFLRSFPSFHGGLLLKSVLAIPQNHARGETRDVLSIRTRRIAGLLEIQQWYFSNTIWALCSRWIQLELYLNWNLHLSGVKSASSPRALIYPKTGETMLPKPRKVIWVTRWLKRFYTKVRARITIKQHSSLNIWPHIYDMNMILIVL